MSEDLVEKASKDLFMKLYGPRLCIHCNEYHTPIVHKLAGSDFSKIEGMTYTIGFTGSYTCSKCYKNMDMKAQDTGGDERE